MKIQIRPLLLTLVLSPLILAAADNPKNCGCACCQGKETCCCHAQDAAAGPARADAAKRHPLKGVITDVLADRSALLVKHEEIPGYMMAMTMLFKVGPADLKAAQKGQVITATLVEKEDGFWLENVKPAGK